MSNGPSDAAPLASGAIRTAQRRARVAIAALGLVLVLVAYSAGSPGLGCPWILGDEYIFVVNNSDVTGLGRDEPLWQRSLRIFTHAHHDLYQPFTILSYAIEWRLWGEGRLFWMRQTDVLIHAVNALLVWAVLRRLLLRFGAGCELVCTGVAWMLALVWTLHPMLVTTYAADMGRTHLLAATFTLLSLLFHLRSLEPGRSAWFLAAAAALLLAMLNKPVVGWVAVVFVLEALLLGPGRTLRSPRIYVVAVLCAAFAVATLRTTAATFMLEDSPLPLFGDPLARAAMSLWFYLRNLLAPLWLAAWYPPDIHTHWLNPRVWLGAGLALAAAGVALLAARRRPLHAVALGLVWLLATWLPVSGIVGARVAAAQDRYFYLPLVGLLLALGAGLARFVAASPALMRPRLVGSGALALLYGAAALPCGQALCREARSTLQRAARVAELYPRDPRVLESLAAAHLFGVKNPTPEGYPSREWAERGEQALAEAIQTAEQHPEYFGDRNSRAAFHRRIAFELWNLGRYERSLQQALRAHDFEPESRLTWLRLAHAYRALERWEDALRAYEKLESLLTPNAPDWGLRFTEFGELLLDRLRDPLRARAKFQMALQAGRLTPVARTRALTGLARCEVLVGEGATGLQLAAQALELQPDCLPALQVVALYHLRSNHWEEAFEAYAAALEAAPTDYEALRGFSVACTQLGRWRDAALAWQDALERDPDQPVFRAQFIWAAACAGEEQAQVWAGRVLSDEPNHRFAHLTKMLAAIRAGRVDQALDCIEKAQAGPALPEARELDRAADALTQMLRHEELPAEAAVPAAALWAAAGYPERARELIDSFLEEHPDSDWRPQAEAVRGQLYP